MTKFLKLLGATAIEIILFGFALGLVYRVWGGVFRLPSRLTVLPFQRGVVMKGESLQKVLGPGSYWMMPSQTMFLCDMRSKPFQISAAEMLTADQTVVIVSAGGEYQVSNPAAFIAESSDAFAAFYLDIRQALGIVVRNQETHVAVLRGEAGEERVRALVANRARKLGVELKDFTVWDVVVHGKLLQTPNIHTAELPVQ